MEESPQVPLSRPWLESLSTGELIKMADSFGIDIPPGLERIFIIEELLENSEDDKQEATVELEVNPSYSEAVALPKHYNISFIEIVIRDPLWVFAFWEIKGHDREAHENANDFNGYCLRVIPLNEGENIPRSRENSFTVAIGADDSARYLGFTEQPQQACGRYIVLLCAVRGETEVQLAASAPFDLPRLIKHETISGMDQDILVHLSGIQDISTIKSTDRQSRVKGQ
jgi:hypothetical protein